MRTTSKVWSRTIGIKEIDLGDESLAIVGVVVQPEGNGSGTVEESRL